MALVKLRIKRAVTIGDPPVFTPGSGDPPTFAPGDIVEVELALAEYLIGIGKAERADADGGKVEAETETATAGPPEAAVEPPVTRRRAG